MASTGFVAEGSTEVTFDGTYKCITDNWNLVDRIRVVGPDEETLYEWTNRGQNYETWDEADFDGDNDASWRILYHETVASYTLMAQMLSHGYEAGRAASERGDDR